MQYQEGASPAGVGVGCTSVRRGTRRRHRRAGHVVWRLQGHSAQRLGRDLRAVEDRARDDEGFHRRARRPGRGVCSDSRAGREADRQRRAGADAPPAGRRHLPYRGRPGPGRALADARRRPRRRACLRAVPRKAVAGTCTRRAVEGGSGGAERSRCWRTASGSPLDLPRIEAVVPLGVRGTEPVRHAGRDPFGDRQEPVRRRASGGGVEVGDPRLARADREGPGLLVRHGPPAAAHGAQRSAWGRGDARSDARPVRRIVPALREVRHRGGPAGRASWASTTSRAWAQR